MKVRELMSINPHVCGPDDSLATAARIMWDHDIGFVPVVNVQRRVIGVVTDRDICMCAYTTGKPVAHVPVSTAMAQRIHACHPNDPVEAVERTMREHQIRRVPVVDDRGFLLGIVSLADLACRGVPYPEVAAALDAVSQSREPAFAA